MLFPCKSLEREKKIRKLIIMIKVNVVIKYCIILLSLIMKRYERKARGKFCPCNGISREQTKTKIISPFIDIVIRSLMLFYVV